MTTLPFVISTGAKRSGEICGIADLSWKCFSCDVDGTAAHLRNRNRFSSSWGGVAGPLTAPVERLRLCYCFNVTSASKHHLCCCRASLVLAGCCCSR